MDAVLVADVHRHGHAARRNVAEIAQLGLAQQGRARFVGVFIAVGRNLHVVERQFALRPAFAEHLHEGRHQRPVLVGPQPVRFALVPEEALDGEGYERCDHGVVESAGLVLGTVDLPVSVEEREVELLEAAHRLAVHPCLDGRAAPAGDDDAHGNIQHLLQVAGEVVGRGARRGDGLGGVLLPLRRALLLRRAGRGAVHGAEADRRRGLGPYDRVRRAFDGLVEETAHGHLHVRLPGAEPHLADQYVAERQRLTVAQLDRVGASGLRGGHGGLPAAVAAGGGCHGLRAPRGADGDFLSGSGFAPELRFGLLLEHHVVAEDAGQDDFRLHCEGRAERGQCEKDSFHGSLSDLIGFDRTVADLKITKNIRKTSIGHFICWNAVRRAARRGCPGWADNVKNDLL